MKRRTCLFGIAISLVVVSFSVVPLAAQEDDSAPSPRYFHVMAYDAESDRVILFGGNHEFPATENILSDTWAYDVSTNTWTEMSPAEAPVGWSTMDYDQQSDRVILFAGTGSGFEVVLETWAYDFNTDTWTNMEPELSPPPVLGARMVYDSESDRMVLFGGTDVVATDWDNIESHTDFAFVNDTWAYDFDSNTWEQMAPAASPPPAEYATIAYDSGSDRVVVMGLIGHENSDETWLYDYNTDTWEMRKTAEHPGPRFAAMVYAAGSNQLILFGGNLVDASFNMTIYDDTWAYDHDTNTWTELSPESFPSARVSHAMVYSTAADRVVLFGGGVGFSPGTNETWLYDPVANTWTQVGP